MPAPPALDPAGDELRRADEVLIKLKRGDRGRAPKPPPRHEAPNADEFLRQLDRAAFRLKPDSNPIPPSATPAHNTTQIPVEHSPPDPWYWRENLGATSSPPVAMAWTAVSVAPQGCCAVDGDISSLLLCEDCRRLGVRLLRVAATAVTTDKMLPKRELNAAATVPVTHNVSTMVDRLRDMATAVGEMQAALGGEERRPRRHLRLARFSEA